jgi:cyclic pyranopterin monophosphate synthase
MLTHLDSENQPTMVDVGAKSATHREAVAQARVILPESVSSLFRDGDIHAKKGPVFQTAIIAGIMACKKTSELIPLCHPLPLDDCKIKIHLNDQQNAVIECRVACHHKTGVEMEALTGATIAALTLYDMCKAISHHIVIDGIRLLEKTGGKSDFHAHPAFPANPARNPAD